MAERGYVAWTQSYGDLSSEDLVRAGRIARRFHEVYEDLAPSFGYETRQASAVPWEQVPDDNKRLMVATVRQLIREAAF